MAGYRTVDELMDILEEECLEFDAVVSIVGGNNKYDYQVITVPKKNVHIKKTERILICWDLINRFSFRTARFPADLKTLSFILQRIGIPFLFLPVFSMKRLRS